MSESNDPPVGNHESLSLEDCEELLKFPYHHYINDVKQEEIDEDFPELGDSGNFVLDDGDDDDSESDKTCETDESRVGEDPEVLASCLNLNKSIQVKLVKALNKVQAALEKNAAKQDEVKAIMTEDERYKQENDTKVRNAKPISLFASPYFRDVRGRVPPDNEDTVAKKRNRDITAYLKPPKPWAMYEKDKLIEGVASNALSYVLKPLKTKRDFLKNKIAEDKNLLEFEINVLKKQIKSIDRKIKKEVQRHYSDIISEAKDHLDWMTISATYLEGSRSEEECERMWNNYMSIFVNKGKFSPEEDLRLKKLVEEHNGRDWDAIAEELQTKRSALQCFERYQTHLNKKLIRKYWTPEEDEQLIKVVETFRIGKYIPWNKVCCYMEGRERHQIVNRYERTINKDIKRGAWTKEEDAMLYACVKKFGKHWTKMREFFPDRGIYQCRERYVNSLDPSLRIGLWTGTEDQKLINLIKKYGYGKWSTIAREMPGRTDNMCLVRAKRLELHHRLHSQRVGLKDETFEPDRVVPKLRPSAPTKACFVQNSKMRQVQDAAAATLQAALQNISPSLQTELSMENIDSSFSISALRELHKELNKTEVKNQIENWTPHYVQITEDEPKKESAFKYELDDESEYEIEEREEEVVEEELFDNSEKIWLQKVLQAKFREEADIGPMPAKYSINLNTRAVAECSIYEKYLQAQMMCAGPSIDEEEEENFVFSGIDYNVTLADIVHHFIQPPVSEDSTMVVAPNCATMLGMDVIQAVDGRLRRTANFLDHSVPYLRYLIGVSQNSPKCIKCCNAEGTKTTEETYDALAKLMKSKFLVMDNEVEKSAMVETRQSAVQEEECCCEELAKSKEAVDLLTRRFMSLFLWPYLLSSIDVSKKQEELLIQKHFVTCPPPYSPKKSTKRKRKNYSAIQERKRERKDKAYSAGIKKKYNYGRPIVSQDEEHAAMSDQVGQSAILNHDDKPNISNLHDQPTMSNFTSSVSVPIRRSRRSCVLNRKSYSFPSEEVEDDELSA